jgi:ATP-binding cassette subfamily B protein
LRSRGFMRDRPLLAVALDAETEHALFERYAAAARGETKNNGDAGNGHQGRITILIPYRFSTVRNSIRPPQAAE